MICRRMLCGAVLAAALASPALAQSEADARASIDALSQALSGQQPDACDAPLQTKADQVVLLHTQLMVASLACGEQYGDPGSYDRYRAFTARNGDLIAGAEQEIQQRLGLQQFDTYRTEIANAESDLIANGSTVRYCRIRHARFTSLIDAGPDQFGAYADDLARRARVSHDNNC